MSHKLERFSKSVLTTPQLVTVEKFSEISEFFESRNTEMYKHTYEAALEANNLFGTESNKERDLVESKVGVLRVQGALTDRPNFYQMLCGGMSYRQLLEDMDYLCSLPEVETILMDVNSPGGEAHNCFATSRELRKRADDCGKKLIAYVDGMSASAGYALTTAAHEVIINPDSQCGSIGVVIQLMEDAEALKKEGYKRIFITAGESKVPFNEAGEFKQEFLEDLQTRVSELYEGFIGHVATMRSIDPVVVRNTQAKMFSAKEGLALGLVDNIMEPTEFYNYLGGDLATPTQLKSSKGEDDDDEYMSNVADTQENLTSKKDIIEMSENTVTPEMFAKLQATLDAQTAQLGAYQAKEVAAEKASLSAELDKSPFLAAHQEKLVSFLMSADTEAKELMNGVIASANLEVSRVQEETATKLAEATSAVEATKLEATAKVSEAKAEAEEAKAEFAPEKAVKSELKENTATEDVLAAKIAAYAEKQLAQ